ncbi:hypothetical protein TeGR_g12244 [Tetraparma gracilis]|uniref:RWD domain-containing protein 3 n=1 Tax=Tetraparma gracilis TaxID=2962635 RepID=A0ABQ6N827_9STRA|nr:hypothetical protein TeGR_g12244 [Tetraparma gracilis]
MPLLGGGERGGGGPRPGAPDPVSVKRRVKSETDPKPGAGRGGTRLSPAGALEEEGDADSAASFSASDWAFVLPASAGKLSAAEEAADLSSRVCVLGLPEELGGRLPEGLAEAMGRFSGRTVGTVLRKEDLVFFAAGADGRQLEKARGKGKQVFPYGRLRYMVRRAEEKREAAAAAAARRLAARSAYLSERKELLGGTVASLDEDVWKRHGVVPRRGRLEARRAPLGEVVKEVVRAAGALEARKGSEPEREWGEGVKRLEEMHMGLLGAIGYVMEEMGREVEEAERKQREEEREELLREELLREQAGKEERKRAKEREEKWEELQSEQAEKEERKRAKESERAEWRQLESERERKNLLEQKLESLERERKNLLEQKLERDRELELRALEFKQAKAAVPPPMPPTPVFRERTAPAPYACKFCTFEHPAWVEDVRASPAHSKILRCGVCVDVSYHARCAGEEWAARCVQCECETMRVMSRAEVMALGDPKALGDPDPTPYLSPAPAPASAPAPALAPAPPPALYPSLADAAANFVPAPYPTPADAAAFEAAGRSAPPELTASFARTKYRALADEFRRNAAGERRVHQAVQLLGSILEKDKEDYKAAKSLSWLLSPEGVGPLLDPGAASGYRAAVRSLLGARPSDKRIRAAYEDLLGLSEPPKPKPAPAKAPARAPAAKVSAAPAKAPRPLAAAKAPAKAAAKVSAVKAKAPAAKPLPAKPAGMSAEECRERQLDEVAVLQAMYPSEVTMVSEAAPVSFELALFAGRFKIMFSLPPLYPQAKITCSLSCPLIPRKQSDQLSLKIRQLSNAKSDSREECVTELVETAVDFATPIFEELDKEGGGDDEEELHVCLLRIDHMNKPSGYMKHLEKWSKMLGLASRVYFYETNKVLPKVEGVYCVLVGYESSCSDFLVRLLVEYVDLDTRGQKCKERKSNVLARRAASPAAAALKGWESQAYKGSRELKELLGALDLADQM